VFKAKEVSALLTLALEKVIDYENSESVISKQIKFAYRLESRKFYFKIENNQWELLDIVFEAGRMHHSHIPSEIKDKRIHKTEIWLHKDDFTKRIYHRNRWALKVGKRQYVRLRPNDIALYSNIVEKNLDSARQVYNDNNSGIWDAFPVDESETIMLDYFENIITAIIFAYTTIETLINICIPFNYVHTKTESNKKTKKKLTVKHSKEHIERWYTLVDKLSEVLPKALDIPSPKQEKWWFNFTQLKDIRNKIVHAVESQSNERYSELLDRQIFDKISSYKQVLDFIGRHLYEQKHFLLNQIPYGLGYDDIRPSLIGDDIYDDF
jgi:hypothetical protein